LADKTPVAFEAAMDEIENDNDDTIEEATEVGAGSTDVVAIIAGLNNPQLGFYSSVKTDSFEDKLAIVRAMAGSEALDNNLGKEIALVNFIIQPVDIANRLTGEVNTAPRIVLMDANGTAYHATSIGILSSLRNIMSVLGEPATWPAPVNVKIIKQKGNNGFSFFTIQFV
jgi:hypothetical protein